MNWVSVKERLPDEGTWAMWFDPRSGMCPMFVGKRCGVAVYWGGDLDMPVSDLTHWAPLPEVPATRAAETVRIRVAVAIDRNGKWTAHAWGDKGGLIESESEIINVAQEMMGDGPGDAVHWVAADVPVPLPASDAVIRGEVQG